MTTKASDYAKIFRAAAEGWKCQNRVMYSGSDATIIRCTGAAFNSIAEVFENIAKAEGEII